MEFLLLGPLEITHEGRSIAPTAAKDRAFLGELLAHPGQLISTEHLADVLWPDRPPANPANAVQVRASRLRAMLRTIADPAVVEHVLRTRSSGYELSLEHAGTDAARFEEAICQADATTLRQGLALWRGAPFADVLQTPCVEMRVAGLEELRLSGVEAYADHCVAEGTLSATLIADLADQAARNPLRESLHHRLIKVLHLSGRSAEALTAYERLRRTLAEELGADPQPELRRLHLEIMADQEPGPAEPAATGETGTGKTTPPARRPFAWVMAIGLALVLGLTGYWTFWNSGQSRSADLPKRPIPGDSSRLDADVTFPDGSPVKVGQRFTKTWKLTNTGVVAWRGRLLARQPLSPGTDGCDSPASVRIPDTGPGQSVLVSVPVEASATPGGCKVYWKMVDERGVLYMPHLSGIFFDVKVIR